MTKIRLLNLTYYLAAFVIVLLYKEASATVPLPQRFGLLLLLGAAIWGLRRFLVWRFERLEI